MLSIKGHDSERRGGGEKGRGREGEITMCLFEAPATLKGEDRRGRTVFLALGLWVMAEDRRKSQEIN